MRVGAVAARITPMLHVPDVRATADWYQAIGFDLVDARGQDGEMDFALLRMGEGEVMFRAGGRPSYAGRREADLVIATDQVDRLFAEVRGRVRTLEVPRDTSPGLREFTIRDCNGFWITFAQKKGNVMSDPAPTGIAQIIVVIRDLERAKSFYRDKLGLTHLFDAPPSMSFFQCGTVRLMLSPPEGDHDGISMIYYSVEDIDESYRAMCERGVVFDRPPYVIATLGDRDVWIARCNDPEGNFVGLMSERAARMATPDPA